MLQNICDEKSTLVQVMALCCQATSHYFSQCWLRSLLTYGINRPWWVNFPFAWVCHVIPWLLYNAVNTLRPRHNGPYFADDIFKCIFLNKNVCISLKISLKFVPEFQINNISALVQIMAWRRPGDKPLSEPMLVNLLTHTCVTRPQWGFPLQSTSNACGKHFDVICHPGLWSPVFPISHPLLVPQQIRKLLLHFQWPPL